MRIRALPGMWRPTFPCDSAASGQPDAPASDAGALLRFQPDPILAHSAHVPVPAGTVDDSATSVSRRLASEARMGAIRAVQPV